MAKESFEEAVHITRGGIVESVHAAAVVVSDPEGAIVASLGDPALPIFLRSAAKPFQASAVVASGAAAKLGLTPKEIALISGSHAGEEIHQETARAILGRAGLDASHLQCGKHTPFSRRIAAQLDRAGLEPTPLMNNCSGKHAGMLAAAIAGGHDVRTYLDPGHPVQRANRNAVAAFTGGPPGSVGLAVDGCSAPTFSVRLAEAARAFARLAAAPECDVDRPLAQAAARVSSAMREHPEMVAGEGMLDTLLMQAIPGLVAKVGAEGIHAMGWRGPEGALGVALKVMDGDSGRARTAIVLAVLRELGMLPEAGAPQALLSGLTIRNHRGLAVGEVRTVFRISPRPGPGRPARE